VSDDNGIKMQFANQAADTFEVKDRVVFHGLVDSDSIAIRHSDLLAAEQRIAALENRINALEGKNWDKATDLWQRVSNFTLEG